MAHMTRDEFQNIINEIAGLEYRKIYNPKTKRTPWGYGPRNILEKRIEIGGMQGGNCWGDEAKPYKRNLTQEDFEFDVIDNILEKICSSIPFLIYKKLQKLYETYEYTESEYYGNCIYYQILRLDVDKLYQFLIDNELI